MLPEYRRVIYDKLARTAGMDDLEQRIVCQAVLTRRTFTIATACRTARFTGSLAMVAFLAHLSREIGGTMSVASHLAGGAAHPGPGMPMALMSGWIAADTLDRDSPGAPLASEAAE